MSSPCLQGLGGSKYPVTKLMSFVGKLTRRGGHFFLYAKALRICLPSIHMYGDSGTLPVPNRGLLPVYVVVVVVAVVSAVVSVVLVVVPVAVVDRGTLGLSSVFKVVSEFSQIRVLESAPSLILQKVSNIFFRSKLHLYAQNTHR